MTNEAVDRLRQIAVGFQQAKILLAAAELRIFDQFRSPATADEVAAAIGGGPRAVEILLDALTSMGLLGKRDGRYEVPLDLRGVVRDDHPEHLAAWLRHLNRLFRNWAFLEERVRGAAIPDAAAHRAPGDHENFIRAMFAVSHRQAEDVVGRIDLAGVKTVADLGGGPGHYLAAFLARSPVIEGYLVDFPATLAVAADVQRDNPDWQRVRGVEWDLYGQPAPSAPLPPLDLAFLSQLIHSESAEDNAAFFKRLAAIIAPGGRVVVHDQILDRDKTAPLTAAVFAVNMLAMTAGGRTYTQREVAAWGSDAGLVLERGERISDRSYLIVLRKPVTSN